MNFLNLLWPFFLGKDRKYAITMGLVLFTLASSSVFLTLRLNAWRERFWNAIQTYDLLVFWHEFWVFCLLAGIAVLLATVSTYLTNRYALRWRDFLTRDFLARWSPSKELSFFVDNPDQRIQEDCRKLSDLTARLAIGIFQSILTILFFVPILWTLSAQLLIPIPGSLLWLSLLYSVGGSLFCFWVGREVPWIQYENQRNEADFRYGLVQLRDTKVYNRDVFGSWKAVVKNYRRLYNHMMLFGFSSNTYFQIGIILPFLVLAPSFFAHAITLGIVMQIINAFGIVNDSFSYLLDRYLDIADLKSVSQRLHEFRGSI